MVSLTGVQNEQAITLRNFAKIVTEVHQFKTQCSSHIITIMKEMNAVQATITSFTARIAALETAPPPPPLPQITNPSPSYQLLALAARIDVLETAPAPPTPPPPPPSSSTALANTASEAIDHGDAIASRLKDLWWTPTVMRPNAVWTSFLVHNVPTSADLEKVAAAIQLNYPTLNLCRHPRWLTTTDKRKEKTNSTVVITLPRPLTLANLGLTSLAISNQACRLTLYSHTPLPTKPDAL
ncbi:hypothetical protein Q9L58_010439 [Maublancomyces gigas]|uniref:Uncharacterized protein n=1 Tax=Discina gigas TaxID=1032678 RepID=A0ABR3G4H1_9PEZI